MQSVFPALLFSGLYFRPVVSCALWRPEQTATGSVLSFRRFVHFCAATKKWKTPSPRHGASWSTLHAAKSDSTRCHSALRPRRPQPHIWLEQKRVVLGPLRRMDFGRDQRHVGADFAARAAVFLLQLFRRLLRNPEEAYWSWSVELRNPSRTRSSRRDGRTRVMEVFRQVGVHQSPSLVTKPFLRFLTLKILFRMACLTK